ncbi:sensor histidine kinase [Labrys neptuniae]|uniref:sensor histidine kinase n=1 Tax=Labrys neptuniae TaxID=376174 RepID=UPI002891FE45|nr:sensor histidine kinase [Labrys neptuniae]MDT3377904.1 sensor histidine kinase [Labrys neptuniae]
MSHFRSIRFHLIVALSILFSCFVVEASWGLSLQSTDGVRGAVSLSGHLAVLNDRSGALTIQDIVAGQSDLQFVAVPSMLTQGYQKGAIWVRFSLAAPEDSRQWLLQIERPLIEQVAVYVPDGAGHFAAVPPSRFHLETEDGVDAYSAVFRISVPSTPADYYIRLQSSTSITTSLNIWQRSGYEKYIKVNDWIIGVVIGSILAMIFANLLYYFWLRENLFIIYAVLLLVSGLISVYHMGYSSEVLAFLEPAIVRRSWGVIVCLYSIFMMLFLEKLFEFRQHSILVWRVSQGVTLLNVAALIFALAGHYGDVGFFVSRLQQISLIFVALFALYLLILRREYQYLLSAVAFLSVICLLSVMQLQYTGFNPLRIDGSLARLLAAGTLIHLVLLSAAVAKRAQLAERNLSKEKDRVIVMARLAEQELTIKVQERTAELAKSNALLKEEMDRRHLLEMKLRQSLASVNDALARKQDFIALASHEFRAPLAVIAATAENLSFSVDKDANNIRLSIAKIRRAIKRMSMLVENILAGEKLSAEQMSPSAIDLNEILHNAEAGMDDESVRRVCFISGEGAVVNGDRNLLEIALQNLIQNALKYSADDRPVIVSVSINDGSAIIDVTDNGSGISIKDRDLIFKKYYRVAGQKASGSGLGLYISREIARQHGGDLVLAASDPSGSTFRVSLPLERARTGNSISGPPVSS